MSKILAKFNTNKVTQDGNYIFDEDLETIGEKAFENNNKIFQIFVPNNVKEIQWFAFNNCQNLTKVILPDNLNVIEENTFQGCKSLNYITLPKNLTLLEQGAFKNCLSLKNIDLPNSLEYIYPNCFHNCLSLEKITLPRELQNIDENVFENCKNLKEIEFNDNLVTISSGAFKNCSALTRLKFSGSLKTIEEGAFEQCNNLITVEIQPYTVVQKNNFTLAQFKFIASTKDDNIVISSSYEEIKNYNNIDSATIMSLEKLHKHLFLNVNEVINNFTKLNVDLYKLISDKNLRFSYFAKDFFKKNELKPLLDKIKNTKLFNQIVDLYEKSLKGSVIPPKFDITVDNEIYFNMFKFAYNLGAFEDSNLTRQKSMEFLKLMIDKGVFPFEKFKLLKTMKLDGFKPEWAEFILNGDTLKSVLQKELTHKNFFAFTYNEFENSQKRNTSNKGKQRQLKPTIESFLKSYNLSLFNSQEKFAEDLIEEVGKFITDPNALKRAITLKNEFYKRKLNKHILSEKLSNETLQELYLEKLKAIKQSKQILKTINALLNQKYSFEMLAKDNDANFVIGKYVNCCAHLMGIGEGIVNASILLPNCQNLVIKNENNEIVAKTLIYINREEQYGVCNSFNISVNLTRNSKEVKNIFKTFINAIEIFAEEYNAENPTCKLKQINIGSDIFNDINNLLESKTKEAKTILPALKFYSYKAKHGKFLENWASKQYVIWKNNEKENKNENEFNK